MAYSPLTHERLLTLLAYDPASGVFTWRVRRSCNARAGVVAGKTGKQGYRAISVDRRWYLAHRLAWFYVYGAWPPMGIDHKNRIRADNRIDNLRLATQSQNTINQPTRRAGLRGVCWHKSAKRWQAAIKARGCNHYLGLFETEEAAHSAYMDAAHRLHGEFAVSR